MTLLFWSGRERLFSAARSGDVNAVRSLDDGKRPLHLAVWNGHYEVLVFLVEKGADLSAKGGEPSEMTALELAQAAPLAGCGVARGCGRGGSPPPEGRGPQLRGMRRL